MTRARDIAGITDLANAKGDIYTATADNTPAVLTVGSDGQTLVANSSQTTGLAYTNNFAAGKNKIINGDFGVWQRGTSFTQALSAVTYCVDRWSYFKDGTGTTQTITQQTFTPAAAPVSGYEGTYFSQILCSVAGSGTTTNVFQQRIEDVRVFAGQTVTMSFWAKADSSRNITVDSYQIFGSGGSADVAGKASSAIGLTTSWARYTATLSVASISGKTVGTSSSVAFRFVLPVNTTFTISIWGVQVEAGSVATAFQTATGNTQSELAACQRYYYRTGNVAYAQIGLGLGMSGTQARVLVPMPVQLRVVPTSIEYSTLVVYDGSSFTVTSMTALESTVNGVQLYPVVASGLTQFRASYLMANSASAYVGFNSEL